MNFRLCTALVSAVVFAGAALVPLEARAEGILSAVSATQVSKAFLAKGIPHQPIEGPYEFAFGGQTPQGIRFIAYGLNCGETGTCATLAFRAGWLEVELPQARFATDNYDRDFLFGRGYLDDDGNPIVQLIAELSGGVTPAYLADMVDIWVDYTLVDFANLLEGPGLVSQREDSPKTANLASAAKGPAGERRQVNARKGLDRDIRAAGGGADATGAIQPGMNRRRVSAGKAAPDMGNWLNQF